MRTLVSACVMVVFCWLVAAPSVGEIIILEAEDYMAGGEGVGFHDTGAGNNGGQYRTDVGDDVDIENASEGGYNVGWTDGGEWFQMTTDPGTWQANPVFAGGAYHINYRVASDPGSGTFGVKIDGTRVDTVSTAATGGWQNWTTVTNSTTLSPKPIAIGAGSHEVIFEMEGGGFNLNYVEFTTDGPPPPPVEAVVRQSAQPFGNLGFNYLYVEAEDYYDSGGSFERSTNPVALATAISPTNEPDPVTGASRGQAITNTYHQTTVTNTSGGGHDATWLVEFDTAGDYYMLVRHHSPLGSGDDRNPNDSMYLPVEFGPNPTQYKANGDNFEILQAGGNGDRNARGPWLWFAARDGVYDEAWNATQDSTTFQVFTVAPGDVGEVLSFQIDHREDGAMIDSIVFVPVGGPVTPENADTYFDPMPLKTPTQSQSFGDDVSELGYSMLHGGTAGDGHWGRNSMSADPGENYGFTGFDGDYFFGRKVNEGALGASDTDPAKLLFDPLGFPGESDIILTFLLAANNDEHGFDVDQDYLNVGFDTSGNGEIDILVDSFETIIPPGGEKELRSVLDPDRPITDVAELWTYTLTIPDGIGMAALVFDHYSTGSSEALAFDSVQIAAVVPEPSTFALAALGLLGLAIAARRRRR